MSNCYFAFKIRQKVYIVKICLFLSVKSHSILSEKDIKNIFFFRRVDPQEPCPLLTNIYKYYLLMRSCCPFLLS